MVFAFFFRFTYKIVWRVLNSAKMPISLNMGNVAIIGLPFMGAGPVRFLVGLRTPC